MTKDERIQGLLEANNRNTLSRRELGNLLRYILIRYDLSVDLEVDIKEALIRSYG